MFDFFFIGFTEHRRTFPDGIAGKQQGQFNAVTCTVRATLGTPLVLIKRHANITVAQPGSVCSSRLRKNVTSELQRLQLVLAP